MNIVVLTKRAVYETISAVDLFVSQRLEPDSIEKKLPEKSPEKPLEKSPEISYTGKTSTFGSLDMSQNQMAYIDARDRGCAKMFRQ